MFENFAKLTVVGVITPKKPNSDKGVIELKPKKDFLQDFAGKKIFFAEAEISIPEFLKHFDDERTAGIRLGIFYQIKNSDILFKNNLFSGTSYSYQNIEYSENYKKILALENKLKKTVDRAEFNKIKAKLFFEQSFEQGKFLLERIENPKDTVLYVNFVTGYAIHLLTGCTFLEDKPEFFFSEKLKKDIDLLYKAYNIKEILDFGKEPFLTGSFHKQNQFSLFLADSGKNKEVKGFILDQIGLQYFEGGNYFPFLEIESGYFTDNGVLPDRWHLINCHSKKAITFDLSNNKGYFTGKNKKKTFDFSIPQAPL